MAIYKIQDVPYISQYSHSDEEKGKNACGVACLAMALAYYKTDPPSLFDLYEECTIVGGYQKGVGWIHSTLVRAAHNHGCLAYAEEFRSVDHTTQKEKESVHVDMMRNAQIMKTIKNIKEGTLTGVSINKGEGKETYGTHLVLVTGVETKDDNTPIYWYVHDPESPDNTDMSYEKISHQQFEKTMRPFLIVYYNRLS